MEREQFGHSIAGFQLTRAKLADMALEPRQGQLLALHLGRRKDAGDAAPGAGQPRQVPQHPARRWRSAARPARSGANGIQGVPGPAHEQPRVGVTYEGTVEMHTLVVGQALTGQSAFR